MEKSNEDIEHEEIMKKKFAHLHKKTEELVRKEKQNRLWRNIKKIVFDLIKELK